MPLSDLYRRQVALLVRVIPLVAAETCFALKGGTAINLFWRDMPRLSVDIDLTYLPVADRAASLAAIDQAMRRMSASIARGTPGARVTPMALQGEDCITRLLVRADGVQIKIEVTPVLRGCVYEPSTRSVSARQQPSSPAIRHAAGYVIGGRGVAAHSFSRVGMAGLGSCHTNTNLLVAGTGNGVTGTCASCDLQLRAL